MIGGNSKGEKIALQPVFLIGVGNNEISGPQIQETVASYLLADDTAK